MFIIVIFNDTCSLLPSEVTWGICLWILLIKSVYPAVRRPSWRKSKSQNRFKLTKFHNNKKLKKISVYHKKWDLMFKGKLDSNFADALHIHTHPGQGNGLGTDWVSRWRQGHPAFQVFPRLCLPDNGIRHRKQTKRSRRRVAKQFSQFIWVFCRACTCYQPPVPELLAALWLQHPRSQEAPCSHRVRKIGQSYANALAPSAGSSLELQLEIRKTLLDLKASS